MIFGIFTITARWVGQSPSKFRPSWSAPASSKYLTISSPPLRQAIWRGVWLKEREPHYWCFEKATFVLTCWHFLHSNPHRFLLVDISIPQLCCILRLWNVPNCYNLVMSFVEVIYHNRFTYAKEFQSIHQMYNWFLQGWHPAISWNVQNHI